MANKMNFINPHPHGLLKDTQDQKNGNCGVRPSENASQVIITQHIFKNPVNGQITAKNIGHGSIVRNNIAFSIKVPLASSGKSITNCIHKDN